jgi:glutamate synthase (NADPH/NADH) small chain
MRNLPAGPRSASFDEVAMGYNAEEAVAEAKRCLQCKNPKCVTGCPVNIDIPNFIARIAESDFAGAIRILKQKNFLPGVCGRVCPQESQCESMCVMLKLGNPVNIGALERFASDWEATQGSPEAVPAPKKLDKDGKPVRVAIAGSGPSGLTVAGELIKMGYSPVIFEAFHIPGGVLVYGIPEFRLPKRIVEREVEFLKKLGVEINPNVVIGKSYTLRDLFQDGFRAGFIGIGAGAPVFMNIPGENLKGVFSANEVLTRLNLLKAYKFPEYDTPVRRGKRVVVFGGGNVAMDAARIYKRIPGVEKVYISYRRSEKEMPARVAEVHHAKEEGIEFLMLTSPVEILGDGEGWVKAVKLIRMELGEPDASGRRRPVPVPGSEFELPVELAIVAVGTRANPLLSNACPGLKLNKWGNIEIDENGMTSLPGVFAGGDIVRGAATVILAMGDGKSSAAAIDNYLKNSKP